MLYTGHWTVGWSDLALLAIFENGHYVLPIRYIFVSPIPKIRRIWLRAATFSFIQLKFKIPS